MRLELLRKLFHIVSILSLLIPLQLFGKKSISLLMFLMLLVFFPVSYFRIKNRLTYPFWKLLEYVEREQNWKTLPGKQAYSLALGLLIVSLLFDEKTLQVSIISVAVYDGIATIAGKIFGKHTIPYTRKSIEGTLSGLIANIFFLTLIIPLWKSIFISVIAAISEIFANSKRWYLDDNFIIPLSVALFFQIIS